MMTRRMVLATLVVSACGYAEEDFLVDEAAAGCEFSVQCYPGLYASVDECIAQRGASVPFAACSFDPDAARDCVKGLQEMTCPPDGEFPQFPAACEHVYPDCVPGADTDQGRVEPFSAR